MKLNCQPGDLAVIVAAAPRNRHLIGRVITVSRLCPLGGIVEPAWFYAPPLVSGDGFPIIACNDNCLRPLRDQAGADETLRIAGLPAPRETTTT